MPEEIEIEVEELKRKVMAIFSKLGVAITNGTAVTLNETEVKILSQTSVGDLFVTCSYNTEDFRIH
jgi:hypothetical protein